MIDPAALRAVEDRQAITDLIYRYCRAVDRIDHQLGYSVWHDDAAADYGPDIYQGTGHGFIDFVCAAHRQLLAHSHQVSNIIIKLDGEHAASESYVTANLRMMRGEQLLHMATWGRYIDRWSRRAGRWGIDKRVTVIDFDEIREVHPMGKSPRSTRDHDDPSYAVLRNPS